QIGVLLVLVEVIPLARREPDDAAPIPGLVRTSFLDTDDGGISLLQRIGGLRAVFCRVLYLRGNILHREQDAGFHAWTSEFRVASRGPKIILAGLSETIGHRASAGNDQAAGRDEGTGYATDP